MAWLKTLLRRLLATGRMKEKPLSNKHFRDNTELKHRAMAGVHNFSQSFHNLLSVSHSNILIQNHVHSVLKYMCFLIPESVRSM